MISGLLGQTTVLHRISLPFKIRKEFYFGREATIMRVCHELGHPCVSLNPFLPFHLCVFPPAIVAIKLACCWSFSCKLMCMESRCVSSAPGLMSDRHRPSHQSPQNHGHVERSAAWQSVLIRVHHQQVVRYQGAEVSSSQSAWGNVWNHKDWQRMRRPGFAWHSRFYI